MSFHLYSGHDVWILVPECMRASHAASALHGPLAFVSCAHPGALSFDELSEIVQQFDCRSFAVVSAHLASKLRAAF